MFSDQGAVRSGAALDDGRLPSGRPPGGDNGPGGPRSAAYHFRSGFGLESANVARRQGSRRSVTTRSCIRPCWSRSSGIGGRLPAGWSRRKPRGIWRLVLRDIEKCGLDRRQFGVRARDIRMGRLDTTRVKVIYLGVEPDFMNSIPDRSADVTEGPLRLLFAGEIGQRKGADVLFRSAVRG